MKWMTPEEMERKREMNKKIAYVSIPVGVVLVSALITVLLSNI